MKVLVLVDVKVVVLAVMKVVVLVGVREGSYVV